MMALMIRVMLLPNFFSEPRRKDIAVWATGMVVAGWFNVLTLYLQDGGFEFAFLYGICESCGCVMMSKVLLYNLEPLFDAKMMDKSTMIKSIKITTYCTVTMLMGTGIAMSATSRLADAVYNAIAFVFFTVFLTGGIFYTILVYYHGTMLVGQLNHLIDSQGVPSETKYGVLQLTSKVNVVRQCAAGFTAVCIFWYAEVIALPILGSIPFHYVMTVVIFHAMLVLCFGGLVLIRPKTSLSTTNANSNITLNQGVSNSLG